MVGNTTVDEGIDARHQTSRTKRLARVSLAALSAISFAAAVRLLMIEATLPPDLWLTELRSFDPESKSKPVADSSFVELMSRIVPSPLEIHARYADCRERLEAASSIDQVEAASANCQAIVDSALRLSPAASELWLERARLEFRTKGMTSDFERSLGMSFHFGRREGWVLLPRLIFCLGIWNELSPELRRLAGADVGTALSSAELSEKVARYYVQNPALRPLIRSLIESNADTEGKERFLRSVRGQLVNAEPAPQR
jgi:hypothetical protein